MGQEITEIWVDEAAHLTDEMLARMRPQPDNPPGTGSGATRRRNARRKRQKLKERSQ